MGEAWPNPGNCVFHTTLLSALQCVGTSFSMLAPSRCGPRHCGQFSARESNGTALRRISESFTQQEMMSREAIRLFGLASHVKAPIVNGVVINPIAKPGAFGSQSLHPRIVFLVIHRTLFVRWPRPAPILL